MAKEIERKFLVKSTAFKVESVKTDDIIQAYLKSEALVSVYASIDKGYVEIDTPDNSWAIGINSVEAEQISRHSVDDLTVRFRLMNSGTTAVQAFLTIKGRSSDDGLERDEWEYEISEALLLDIARTLKLQVLLKVRYHCPLGSLTIEVDEFSTGFGVGDEPKPPFYLAEIEFPVGYDHTQPLQLPDWIGDEVTGNVEYYNSVLIKSGKIRAGVIHNPTKTN